MLKGTGDWNTPVKNPRAEVLPERKKITEALTLICVLEPGQEILRGEGGSETGKGVAFTACGRPRPAG